MEKLADLITKIVESAFVECNYSSEYGIVTLSNRPDLCQFQCNGALTAAKTYKKSLFVIANEIIELLKENRCFKDVSCVMPGFINITLSDSFLLGYLNRMLDGKKFGCEDIGAAKTIIVDYGG